MNAFLKKCFSGKKSYYAICVTFFALALLAAGISLAYFTSHDEVTNRLNAPNVEIALLEPQWDIQGKEDATHAEPGMTIAKDPYVYNKSDVSVYVRMKIEITDENGEAVSAERYNAILAQVILDGKRLFTGTTCNHPNFYYDSESGWYYYGTQDALTVLDPQQETDRLFTGVYIPILKSQFNGVFDTEYHIVVTAQAISTDLVDVDEENGWIQSAPGVFEAEYAKRNT